MAPVEISYVVPAFNEQTFIALTLAKIHQHTPAGRGYEIIVVDHGSTDATVALAEAGGARVVKHNGGTVGELRNIGAATARGEFLVFLDADVFLTQEWARHSQEAFDLLRARPKTITGSWYGLPAGASWIERWWFGPLVHQANSHINSGHLMVTRRYFQELGGFDPGFETGEDFELSARVRRRGGAVVENPSLAVEHQGYPKTLRRFVRREAWHGLADFRSPVRLMRSRVALATCGFASLHLGALVAALAGAFSQAGASLGAAAGLCVAASCMKYGVRRPALAAVNTVLYYFYFLGRTLALLRSLRVRELTRHQRAASG